MKRSREWLAGAVLGVGGLLFSLLLLEAGVRMLHLVPDRFWEPDRLLGARLIAGASGWWTQEEREFVTPIEINSEGRRDVERPREKPEGVVRVLVLGDSFTEAMQVPLDQAYFRRLEAALNEDGSGRRYEVLGAGVSGYGTAGATLYFETEGYRYEPDLVLLGFYPGNDIQNNSPTLEDRLPPVYDADGSLLRVEGSTRAPASGWLPEWKTYRYLRKMILTQQPQVARFLVGLGLMQDEAIREVPTRDGVPLAYGAYAVPPDAEWDDAWRRTESLLERLRASAVAHKAQFALAIFSIRDQIYPEYWSEIVEHTPGMAERSWDLDAPGKRVEDWCRRSGAACLALAPAFRERRAADEEPLHFRQDGHWTAAGHALAAAELEDFIARQLQAPLQ